MSHSQFHSIKRLYLDMHGLIFETSIWLLAGSTRYLSFKKEPPSKISSPPTRDYSPRRRGKKINLGNSFLG